MDPEKIKRLEVDGWKVGDIKELLNLTEQEIKDIEEALALAPAGPGRGALHRKIIQLYKNKEN